MITCMNEGQSWTTVTYMANEHVKNITCVIYLRSKKIYDLLPLLVLNQKLCHIHEHLNSTARPLLDLSSTSYQ